MNRKELSEAIAEAAARTEAARADIEVSRAGIEAARKRQEEAIAQQQRATAQQQEAIAQQQEATAQQQEATAQQRAAIARQDAAVAKFEEVEARRDADWVWLREATARHEKLLHRQIRGTDEIIAELRDQRDERRALIEALLRLTDRLPPPPPHLKSA